MRLLVIEDEPRIAEILKSALQRAGFTVDVVALYVDAREALALTAYDAATGDRLWLSTYDGGGPAFEGDMAVSPDGSSIYLTGQLSYACYSDCPATTMSAP